MLSFAHTGRIERGLLCYRCFGFVVRSVDTDQRRRLLEVCVCISLRLCLYWADLDEDSGLRGRN
jgi:hypothetical protein